MNYTIPPFYDSMISKLIVWARTRDDAIARMRRALREYIILGVKTTIPFHKAIMKNENFQAANLHTHFVDEHRIGIMEDMQKVLDEDKEIEARLKSTFLPSKKVAAISAAVNNYMAHTISGKKG